MRNPHAELGSVSDYAADRYDDKKFFFVLAAANAGSTYIDKKTNKSVKAFPASYLIPLEAQVYHVDPVSGKGRNRIMRYIPGESSIWKDEQSPDKDVPKVKQMLEFVEGRRLVNGTEKELLELLMRHPANASNPDKDPSISPIFKLIDMDKEVEDEIESSLKLHEAVNWCFAGDFDEVAAYARALNISITGKKPSEIRYRMSLLAKKDVGLFLSGMRNPKVLRKHYVLEAIENNILSKDQHMNALLWKTGHGGILIQAPQGVSPVDYFVDHSVTPQGEGAYLTLMRLMGKYEEPAEVKPFTPTPVPTHQPLPELKPSGITFAVAEQILEIAIDKKIIVVYGRTTHAFDMDISGPERKRGPRFRSWNGRQGVINSLTAEPEFLKMVQDEINAQ